GASGHGAGALWRPASTNRCQDCHMPLEPTVLGDAAARPGPDGVRRVRSHRFLGANAALPHLRGDEEQERRTAEFLRGKVNLDLAWAARGDGAPGPLLDVVLRARGIGHRFPGGTMDSNEVW